MKTHEEMIEVLGSVIDIFEDFLEEKGIKLPNSEKKEYDNGELSGLAIIFGSDYDWISDKIEEVLNNKLK